VPRPRNTARTLTLMQCFGGVLIYLLSCLDMGKAVA